MKKQKTKKQYIEDLDKALYYATREFDGMGLEAKDTIILDGLKALESGVSFEDSVHTNGVTVPCFIEACRKRDLLASLDYIMAKKFNKINKRRKQKMKTNDKERINEAMTILRDLVDTNMSYMSATQANNIRDTINKSLSILRGCEVRRK